MSVPVNDVENADIKVHFQKTIGFIRESINQGGRVLVHCYAGMSRSVTIAVAYLMQEHQMKMDEALRLIRQKRPYSEPNPGFMKQLAEFERELGFKPNALTFFE
jgi:protein-tyrosine phosphatase